jgi:Leucine-rich repeat (LRR) protein
MHMFLEHVFLVPACHMFLVGAYAPAARMQGLWLHGNLLASLPASLSQLTALRQLSVSGNCLTELPDVWAGMQRLEDLAAAGNMLQQVGYVHETNMAWVQAHHKQIVTLLPCCSQ